MLSAVHAPVDVEATRRFLEMQELGLLEKPLGFAKTPSYNNYMCCIGLSLATVTGW